MQLNLYHGCKMVVVVGMLLFNSHTQAADFDSLWDRLTLSHCTRCRCSQFGIMLRAT